LYFELDVPDRCAYTKRFTQIKLYGLLITLYSSLAIFKR
jgi:hypothetical protein